MNEATPAGMFPADANSDPKAWGQRAAQVLGERLRGLELGTIRAQVLEVKNLFPAGPGGTAPAGGQAQTATANWSGAIGPVAGAMPVAATDWQELERNYRRASELTEQLTGQWLALRNVIQAGVGGAISTIGDGIAGQLVDGTYDWERAWKNVLKQVISVTAQMLIIQGINAAIMAMTSGAGAGAGSLLKGMPFIFHSGGTAAGERHHAGELKADEVPAILQTGEFVLRREAVRRLGATSLYELNRTGELPEPGTTFQIQINVEAAAERSPRALAESIAEPLIEILRREEARNRRIF